MARALFTDKVFISTPEDTGPAYTQMKLQTARGPLDPLTTAVLDQPPGRAANNTPTQAVNFFTGKVFIFHTNTQVNFFTGKVFIFHTNTQTVHQVIIFTGEYGGSGNSAIVVPIVDCNSCRTAATVVRPRSLRHVMPPE